MKTRYSSYCYTSIFEVWFSIGDPCNLDFLWKKLVHLSDIQDLKVSVKCCKFLSSGVALKSSSNVMFS